MRDHRQVGPPGSTEHPDSDDVLVVSWPKDRERYGAVLRELPLMRFLRSAMWWSLVVSGSSALLLWAGDAQVAVYAVAVVPGLLGVTCYLSACRSNLKAIGEGTITWRLSREGLRIEGDTATEIPWSQQQLWRRAAGHLIIELRRPGGSRANPAVAAPLQAFDPAAWRKAEVILRSRLGAER